MQMSGGMRPFKQVSELFVSTVYLSAKGNFFHNLHYRQVSLLPFIGYHYFIMSTVTL